MKTKLLILALGALLATSALAEEEVEGVEVEAGADKDEAGADKAGADKDAARKRILGAIALPDQADDLRKGGMSKEEVGAALDALQAAGAHASEARDVLDSAESDGEGDAWRGEFGQWVKTQVDSGKGGKELSEAVRSEKTARREQKAAMKASGEWKERGEDGDHGKSGELREEDREKRGASGELREKAEKAEKQGKAAGQDKSGEMKPSDANKKSPARGKGK